MLRLSIAWKAAVMTVKSRPQIFCGRDFSILKNTILLEEEIT